MQYIYICATRKGNCNPNVCNVMGYLTSQRGGHSARGIIYRLWAVAVGQSVAKQSRTDLQLSVYWTEWCLTSFISLYTRCHCCRLQNLVCLANFYVGKGMEVSLRVWTHCGLLLSCSRAAELCHKTQRLSVAFFYFFRDNSLKELQVVLSGFKQFPVTIVSFY